MGITGDWQEAIGGYLTNQRAGGAPKTTINSRRQHLQNLARGIGAGPYELTGEALVEWTGTREWEPETRRGRRTTFRSFYAWAVVSGRMSDNPALLLPKVKPVIGAARPTPDRVYKEAVMRAKPRQRLWLRLAGELGLRRGEVAAIHSDDVQEDLLGYSLLVHGKGNRERVVPLTPGIARDLLALPAGYAFPGERDGHLSPEWIGKQAAKLLEGKWTMHTLRHRFAARTYEIDNDLFGVQELLGHASPATTRRYVPRASQAKLRHLVMAASDSPVKLALTPESRARVAGI